MNLLQPRTHSPRLTPLKKMREEWREPGTEAIVPRPSLTAFFAAVENSVCVFFSTAAKKSCEGRPGYEAKPAVHEEIQGLL